MTHPHTLYTTTLADNLLTHMHARMHTHTHTHARTYTHTHTLSLSQDMSCLVAELVSRHILESSTVETTATCLALISDSYMYIVH